MKLIGTREASSYLGISPELVRYRALAGHLRIARRSPLRFRVGDVIQHAKTSSVRRYTRKPTALDLMNDKLATLLAATANTDPTLARKKRLPICR